MTVNQWLLTYYYSQLPDRIGLRSYGLFFLLSCIDELSYILMPLGPTLIRVRWICVCSVDVFTDIEPFFFQLNPRKLGNVQLIPYLRGLQQERQEWELNLYPSAIS